MKREVTNLPILRVTVGTVLVACVLTSSCSSTSNRVPPAATLVTWGGLRFGMTPDQARNAIKGRLYEDHTKIHEKGADGEGDHPYGINIRDVTVDRYKGEAALTFDENKTLTEVTLFLVGTANSTDLAKLDVPLRVKMVEDISNMLLERYGKPIGETGEIPASDQLIHFYFHRQKSDDFKSTRMWKFEGQLIKEDLTLFGETGFFFISYKPENHEL